MQQLLHKDFVTNALQIIFCQHSIFCSQPNPFHFVLCCAVRRGAPWCSCFPPGIVCSRVGNCSNAFPNIIHWEGKYKMGLHLAWLESRILREEHIIVTVSRGDNLSIWELSFLRTTKFCQTYRHTNAKAATYPTLQPVAFCLCLYQQFRTKNCLGKLQERDSIHQLPILAVPLLSAM